MVFLYGKGLKMADIDPRKEQVENWPQRFLIKHAVLLVDIILHLHNL